MTKYKDILVSFWQLTSRVIFARKVRVLFYYPQHFNRTAQATNPFFDRLLKTCQENNISYHLIEEPDWGTDKPRNPLAIKGDVLFVLITILRKLFGFVFGSDTVRREHFTGKTISIITLGRLKHPFYVTISGSMLTVFLSVNKHAVVYDMQHGILYKQHPTFFDEYEHLRTYIAEQPRWHWLFWGKGYEKCFSRGDEQVLHGRTHVVGYPVAETRVPIGSQCDHVVLFSLQFTHDWQPDQLQVAKQVTDDALRQLVGKNVRVLLKHHPRFNDSISIGDLLEKYPFAELTTLSIQQLIPITLLQVTINSTTAFEYAAKGIVSFFIDPSSHVERGNLFYQEYHYPLYSGMPLGDVVERLQNDDLYKKDSEIVRAWYREYYDEFNEQAFLKLIS